MFRLQLLPKQLKTPCYIVDEQALEENLKVLAEVQKRAGCKILLALKAFSMYSTFPLVRKYLSGVCASGLHEARLGAEEFGKEVHTYSSGFKDDEFLDVVNYSDHIVFNSLAQWKKYGRLAKGKKIGLRVNPETTVACSRFGVYDPCAKNSRLGIKEADLRGVDLEGITGLHFHALCEQDANDLETVLKAFERKFARYFGKLEWVNFGGGHHITRDDYDQEKLIAMIIGFRQRYPHIKEIYLEPGEAIALNTGVLVAQVVDIVQNEKKIAILDTSVECHLVDVLITRHEKMPFVPEIVGAGHGTDFPHTYLIGGVSCAAGDVIGQYSFKKVLSVGEQLIFLDTAHYTMVKTTTFNGVPLPSMLLMKKDGKLQTIKTFGYEEFKRRI